MINVFRFWLRTTKRSTIAFGAALVLGLLSMGFLGISLYYLVAPVLLLRFPPQDRWHGDWVWPAIIGVGMGWSLAFLFAGAINYWLVQRTWPTTPRRLIYLGVLWGWALVVWFVCLTFAPVQPL